MARLATALGGNLRWALDMFWARQWSSNSIWDLDRYNKAWRRQPVALFAFYDALKQLGCPDQMAFLALHSASLFKPDDASHNAFAAQQIWEAISVLRECGYNDSVIRTMLSAHPKAFLKPRNLIAAWHAQVVESGMSPLIQLGRLTSITAKTARKKRQEPKGFTTDIANLPREADLSPNIQPAATATSDGARQPGSNPVALPVPDANAASASEFTIELPADISQDVPAQIQQAIAATKTGEEKSPVSSKPLELILAAQEEADETPPPSAPRVAEQPAISQSQHSAMAPRRQSSTPPDVFLPKPSRMPSVVPTPNQVPREPLPPPYVPEDTVRNWAKLAQAILAAAAPKWNDAKWAKWHKKCAWIDSTVGAEVKNLEQVFSWVRFSESQPPHDERTRLLASILLGRDLAAKRKTNGSERPRPDLTAILRLPEEAVYFRCYALRSILRREFTRHPEALAYAWENVVKFENPTPRNFSIPPPPMDDEGLWKAKAAELRFRANEIEAHGYLPGRKPFVLMALEPAREKFLERLARYVKRHGPGNQTKRLIRNTRKQANPYLSLS